MTYSSLLKILVFISLNIVSIILKSVFNNSISLMAYGFVAIFAIFHGFQICCSVSSYTSYSYFWLSVAY